MDQASYSQIEKLIINRKFKFNFYYLCLHLEEQYILVFYKDDNTGWS